MAIQDDRSGHFLVCFSRDIGYSAPLLESDKIHKSAALQPQTQDPSPRIINWGLWRLGEHFADALILRRSQRSLLALG
jgi:hypothetical protein